MPEQELDLFEIPAGLAAQLRAGAAEIVRADLPTTARIAVAQALAHTAALRDRPQQRALSTSAEMRFPACTLYLPSRITGHIRLLIETSGAGVLLLGHALHTLEKQEPGLGPAFYQALMDALYPWMRVYDYNDAESFFRAEDRDDRHGSVRALDRDRFCNRQAQASRGHVLRRRGLERVDGEQLPVWLVGIEVDDAIGRCFDDEAESMYESINSPTCLFRYRPGDLPALSGILGDLSAFVSLNRLLARLDQQLATWKETHDDNGRTDRRLDRLLAG